MIEIAMYVVLGALVAGLVALAIIPAIWKRAVHLTERRIEATVPLEVEEIRAEKDRMRAEFALTIRRMEKKLDLERNASAARRIEINQQTEALHSAAAERDAKAEAIGELEERERVLRAELRGREEELVRISANLREAERKLTTRDNEIAILKGDTPQPETSFAFLSNLVEEGDDASLDELDAKTVRREFKATRREFEAAKIRIATLENELDSTRAALEESKQAAERLRIQAADDADISTLDSFASSDRADRRRMEAEIVELEARRVENEAEITRLTIALENAQAGGPSDLGKKTKSLQAETQALKTELDGIARDRDRIIAENAELKRRLGEEGDDVEQENAALREKISELAANIANMTAKIEGDESQIKQLVDAEEPAADTSTNPSPTLAARIRKLAQQTSTNGGKRP